MDEVIVFGDVLDNTNIPEDMSGQTDAETDRQVGYIDGQTNKVHTDIGRQADRQTYRQTDKQHSLA